ncbi:MAG: polysaccharide biosynthesis tyrosine autokinase, partial [Planctomycetota bacterium]
MDKHQPQVSDVINIKQLMMEVVRRKFLVATILIVGLGITYTYTAAQPVLYNSTASLLIESFVPTQGQTINNYNEMSVSPDVIKANRILAESRPVRERAFNLAQEKLGEPETAKINDMQARSDGQLLYLQVLDTDPKRAAAYANAWSDAFVAEMKDRGLKKVEGIGAAYKQIVPKLLETWHNKTVELQKFEKENNFNAKDYDLTHLFEMLKPVGQALEEKKAALNDLKAEITFLSEPKRELTYDDLKSLQSAKSDPDFIAFKAEVERSRIMLRETQEKFQPEHAEVVAKKKRVTDAQKDLDDAAAKYLTRLKNALQIVEQERVGLQERYSVLEKDKNKLIALSLQWSNLNKAMEEAEKLYIERNQAMNKADFDKQMNFTFANGWETAVEPVIPYLPSWKRNLAAGGFFSLIAAVLSVILLDKLDDTIRTPKDLQRKQGLNSLGMIPASDTVLDDQRAYTLVQHSSFSLVSEALRNLHIGLEVKYSAHRTGQPLVITVTSALANEGKSMVSSNLALLFAGLGRKVLIVDADLRKRSLSRAYKADGKSGLRDIIHGMPFALSMTVPGAVPGFFLLPAGLAKPDATDTMQPESFERALAQMKPGFDVIIFDTPPVLPMADACIMGQMSDVTILVVRSRRTSLRQVEAAVSNLTTANVKEIGCIVNGVDNGDAS